MRRRRPLPLFAVLVVSFLGLGACAQPAAAQDPQTDRRVAEAAEAVVDTAQATGRANTVVLPVLGYTPDTGLALGGLALRFFRLDPETPDARPSVISPVIIYTLKNQWIIFLGTDLNWDDGRWHAGLVPGYQKFPDDFYGLGRGVPADPLESFTPEQFSLEAQFERRVLGALRLGLSYRGVKHQLLKTEPGGLLAGGAVDGTGRSVVSAPGVQAAWDTRDNTWWPRQGLWVQTGLAFARGRWGSDADYTESRADLRGYLPLGGRGALAAQVLYRSVDGPAPFYELPRLGGDNGLRGYTGGRLLDRTALLARVEWRSGMVWRRLGAVAFAGWGDVAPRPGDLTTAGGLVCAGLGLRWTISPAEKVNLRLDVGTGRNDGGFFVSLGEAF